METGTNTRGDRRSTTEPPERPADDPAELSTQSSAPGVLKIFGDEICAGANYKSVLATPRSSAQELVKEALERYSLNKTAAHSYVLCDVIGRLEGGGGIGGGGWRTECLRALGDNEKPLLLQELWKPREGHARRFELRRRAEVEELNAKEKDTITAGEETQRNTHTLAHSSWSNISNSAEMHCLLPPLQMSVRMQCYPAEMGFCLVCLGLGLSHTQTHTQIHLIVQLSSYRNTHTKTAVEMHRQPVD